MCLVLLITVIFLFLINLRVFINLILLNLIKFLLDKKKLPLEQILIVLIRIKYNLPVKLAKNNVLCTNNCNNVGN